MAAEAGYSVLAVVCRSAMRRTTFADLGLDNLLDRLPKMSKAALLTATAALVAGASLADYLVGHISLGILYIMPMMTGALLLEPLELAALALLCAFLRSLFDYPGSSVEIPLRFAFASVSYFTCGLFVAALIQNRRIVREHLGRLQREQDLRKVAEDQLRILVAGSPAAILTIDDRGRVIAANQAAASLFAISEGQRLEGQAIEKHLSVLSDALRLGNKNEGFRTAAQCTGYRANGEVFQAHTWFSSYIAPEGLRLAAIVVDASEEMRDREEQNLRQLLRAIRVATTAVSHESRNLAAAISLLCAHLAERHGLSEDEDLKGIVNLAKGIEKMAALDLSARRSESRDLEKVPLRQVLDHLRIIIEPEWIELEGRINWSAPARLPSVIADPHGLLQAFLNLAKNSYRAVLEAPRKELNIEVSIDGERAIVRFEDSGAGLAAPERLFQPFQEGADGTGVGLYLSRAVVRSYGGELRYESEPGRSRFVIELEVI